MDIKLVIDTLKMAIYKSLVQAVILKSWQENWQK